MVIMPTLGQNVGLFGAPGIHGQQLTCRWPGAGLSRGRPAQQQDAGRSIYVPAAFNETVVENALNFGWHVYIGDYRNRWYRKFYQRLPLTAKTFI